MKLAVFDFDGTLFEEETLPYLVKHYGRKGYSGQYYRRFWREILVFTMKYKLKIDPMLDKEKYRAEAVGMFIKLFEGMTEEEVKLFFRKAATEMPKHFNLTVSEWVHEMKAKGYHTVVCSGANTLLLEEIVSYVPFDTVIGTDLYFLEDGTLNYDVPLTVTSGMNKPLALKKKFEDADIDWSESWAFGDSYYDYDVLTLTGHPVAVNPDKSLREIASKEGWKILD